MQTAKVSVYNAQFALLCTSSFLFFASFNMIIPELPAYLSSLGGEDYKGLIISLFTLTAGLSRPFSGKLADTIGRKPVIFFGVFMSFLCGLMYPILTTVAGFLLLRFLHGFSTGFAPTGNSAFVADVVPPSRRGEAMGILGLTSNIGTAIGPAMGSEIASAFSMDILFYTAAGCAISSMLILINIRETLRNPQEFQWKLLRIKKHEIIEPRVLAPSIVMLLALYTFGVVLTLIPDLSVHLELRNKGVFFTFYTISSLFIRFIAGRLSDRYGRIIVLKWGMAVLVMASIWIGLARTGTELLMAACLFGIAVGMNAPTIFAWTIDLSHDRTRGKALATLYISLELGIGLGALSSAWVYNNQIENLSLAFFLSAGVAMLGLIFMQFLLPYTLPRRGTSDSGL